jgi:5'-methylthioadenosine phosphorylase
MLAVIGGSGIYDLGETGKGEISTFETPFGTPSSPIRRASVGETDVLFLARHGVGHVYSPTSIPYRANVFALKELGATHLLSLSSVGSLREELSPRTLVIPDQIIDRTVSRQRTFFDSAIVAHVGIADPFCSKLRNDVARAAELACRPASRGGTYICIEGPQFSTRAESNLYRDWGASVIGMTAMPEARLAREAGLCYAMLAMVTDYDVWHDSEADVSVEVVASNLRANREAAREIVMRLAAIGSPGRDCGCRSALDHAIMTERDQIPVESLEWMRVLAGHLPQQGR